MTRPGRTRARATALAAVAVAVLAGGCTSGDLPSASVNCDDVGALTLVAQAVPEAESVPCFPAMPFGYRTTTADIESGRAELTLSHAVIGPDAVVMTIAEGCLAPDAGDPLEPAPAGGIVATTERTSVGGVSGHLVQDLGGACLVAALHLDHPDGPRALTDLEGSWQLMSRERLAESLAQQTDGRLRLR